MLLVETPIQARGTQWRALERQTVITLDQIRSLRGSHSFSRMRYRALTQAFGHQVQTIPHGGSERFGHQQIIWPNRRPAPQLVGDRERGSCPPQLRRGHRALPEFYKTHPNIKINMIFMEENAAASRWAR